jgi:hypothetical protein
MINETPELVHDGELTVRIAGEPRLYVRSPRLIASAHPFSEDELSEFEASGEHLGLD